MLFQELSNVGEKLKLLIYGASGSGKTMFSATAINKYKTLYISFEGGLSSIRKGNTNEWTGEKIKNQPMIAAINSYSDIVELYKMPDKAFDSFDVIVVDSITEFGNIVSMHLMGDGKNVLNQLDWQKVKNEFKKFLDFLKQKKKHFVVIGQENVEKDGEILLNYSVSASGFKAYMPYYFDVVARSYKTKKGEYGIEVGEMGPSDAKSRLSYINPKTKRDLTLWIDLFTENQDEKEGEVIVSSEDLVVDFKSAMEQSGFDDEISAKKIHDYVLEQNNQWENRDSDPYRKQIEESGKFTKNELIKVNQFIDIILQ